MATKRRTKETSVSLVDQQLERYRSMRDFSTTQEPSGSSSPRSRSKTDPDHLPFVIQKHAATRLHYDFRLGWNGVLKSWAVTKGPSYVTSNKRLAVQVEDHPMEYGGFEGIIPQGQYGGGTVMLWDTGTWAPQPGHADVNAGLRDGSLKFTMNGTKMKGNWALIRMGGKAATESKPNWLLIKEHDHFERDRTDPDVLIQEPNSVITGRSLEEIAAEKDHVWNSKKRSDSKPKLSLQNSPIPSSRTLKSSSSTAATIGIETSLNEFPKEKLPDFIPPQLAVKTATPPSGSDWLHELKLDGYRIEAHKNGDEVKLFTRSGLDWTHRMKSIAADIAKLPAKTAILDGEVVVLAKNGTTSFADLQASLQEGAKHALTYFVFDLLHLNGRNLRDAELTTRKDFLSQLLQNVPEAIKLSEHIRTDGEDFFQAACKLRAEGIISKRASGKYVSGRSSQWMKVKCAYDQEFVIAGFTLPSNGITGVGALLLGYYDDDGRLIYAGRTGTGFTQKTHRLLREKLDKLKRKQTAFESVPGSAKHGAIWVKPTLVAQVSFATWTADNLVRQAAFKGLREDKPASEVHREQEIDTPTARSKTATATHRASNSTAAKNSTIATPKKKAAPSKIASAPIRLTHPDKVVDAQSGLTKQQLADYYWAIANHMLPHVSARPLSLVRCPEGTGEQCFFQKHLTHLLPPGIQSVNVPDKKTGKMEPYITLSTPEALAGLAQIGVLEVHPWGSRNDDLEHPDRIIIDLDPDQSLPWTTIAAAAEETRNLFKKLGLKSFLKSTGGKGLHIVVPITPKYDWDEVKDFTHKFAIILEKRNPSLYLTKMSKAARTNRIFIDYLRNDRGATAVAPYSPRARAGVTVSMPLSWSELKSPIRPSFSVVDFPSWKDRLRSDPWKELLRTSQQLFPLKISELS
jgi:bifunctional non-homologous end joining protein LigD